MDQGGLLVEDLRVTLRQRSGVEVQAVRGVSFEVPRGETLTLVGESGSGKTATILSLLRLHRASARVTGRVRLGAQDLSGLDAKAFTRVRGRSIGLVPQDPTGSLDPLRRVGSQIGEVMKVHLPSTTRRARRAAVLESLDLVGIADVTRVARAYPHELSGGMQQRVAIALAISCRPTVLLADEPTSALDVTVQAEILDLFLRLENELAMALLLVTHDVGVARELGGTVGVMYAGRIVELGPASDVTTNPTHPYTRGLLESVPGVGVARGALRVVQGAPPAPGLVIEGCAFAPRCPRRVPACEVGDAPTLVEARPGRLVACPVALAALPGAAPAHDDLTEATCRTC
jgi:oligopeptide/dipeptide ABC transporter ATP-binding protein